MSHDRLGASDPANGVDEVADDRVAPGRRTLTGALGQGVVQRRAITGAPTDAIFAPLDTAEKGVEGAGAPLPHASTIERSFGRHAGALDGVRAHTGGAAATAAAELGAEAYATGSNVAFASAPDLHLAAHEAAHVVQQRAGVSLAGGVGAAGDPYERHADRVADAVVSGASAEAILDEHAGGGARAAVQRFEEGEHAEIGNAASGDRVIELAPDYALPFGFVTMLAGDHVGTFEELVELAQIKPNGKKGTREELDFVIADNGLLPELERILEAQRTRDPKSSLTKGLRRAYYEIADRHPSSWSEEAKASATTKYKQLALQNYNHFDQPFDGSDGRAGAITMEEEPVAGAGQSRAGEASSSGAVARWTDLAPLTAPRAYRYHHLKAIEAAVQAGLGGQKVDPALLREGFASHFLSDSFAAGHARTARFSIQQYWNGKLPMFGLNLRGYLAQTMAEALSTSVQSEALVYEGLHLGRTGLDAIDDQVNQDGAFARIHDALADITGFGFGDLVSAVVHDYDNVNGILADVEGRTVELFGDGNLQKGDTRVEAVEAVARGIADIDRAYAAAQGGTGFDEVVGGLITDDGFFRAEKMIPTALPDHDGADQTNQTKPRWDFSTLEDLLADETFRQGLIVTMREKKSQFEAALAGQRSDVKAAFKERVLSRLDDPASARQFLRDVIDWAPVLEVGPTSGPPGTYSMDEAFDYVKQARDTDGGLASLTTSAREKLLLVLGQSTSLEAQQAQYDVIQAAPAAERATLTAQHPIQSDADLTMRNERRPLAHAE